MPEDSFRKELQTEIKLVLELTARVDERVKLLIDKQVEITTRLNSFIDSHNNLSSRVSVIESKGTNGIGELKEKYNNMIERIIKIEASPHSLSAKLDYLEDNLKSLETIVSNIEDTNIKDIEKTINLINNNIQQMNKQNESLWGKCKFVFDLVIKAIWVIIVCYFLYKLGINSPPLP